MRSSVGGEVGRDVALVEAHALGQLEVEPEGVGLLDGDDAFLADLVHRLGDDLADGGVSGGDRRGRSDLLLGLDVLGHGEQLYSDTAATAASMPRLRSIGLAPAATLRRPSRTMAWASTVAVVVPSPATSSVFLATSLTSSAPIFSYGSSSSISLAIAHTVVGDRGGAPLLLQDDVAALGAEGDLDRVGEGVHTPLEAAAGLLVESNQLGHIACDSYRRESVSRHQAGCPRRTIHSVRRSIHVGSADLSVT
jgi:hypothetical protein